MPGHNLHTGFTHHPTGQTKPNQAKHIMTWDAVRTRVSRWTEIRIRKQPLNSFVLGTAGGRQAGPIEGGGPPRGCGAPQEGPPFSPKAEWGQESRKAGVSLSCLTSPQGEGRPCRVWGRGCWRVGGAPGQASPGILGGGKARKFCSAPPTRALTQEA